MAELRLTLLAERFAICQLPPEAPLPARFFSVTRTGSELSLVVASTDVPPGARVEDGWRALRVQGPVDFSLAGILESLLAPLAHAGVSVFAISTFDTDYVLVREPDLQRALEALRGAGHSIAALHTA